MTAFKWLTGGATMVLCTGAAGAVLAQGGVAMPPVPAVHGPLKIIVAHPAAGSAVDFGDSTFLFGSVGDGAATLTIAGQPVAVAPNGAWLAWVALPHDSSLSIALAAHLGADSAKSVLHIARANWVRESGAWVDLKSRAPTGRVWLPRDELLPLTVRAAPGAAVRLMLPNGKIVRFLADSIAPPPADGIRNFDRDDRNLRAGPLGDRYVAMLSGDVAPGSAPAGFLDVGQQPSGRPPAPPLLEVALHGKVTRVPWPIQVTRITAPPVAVLLDAGSANQGAGDRITIGRAFPAGTYTWFLPPGTRARADMRVEDQVRLRLSHDAIAWVPLADVHHLPALNDARPAIMGSPTLATDSTGTRLRIPLTRPVVQSVAETEHGLAITLFDVVSDANWTRYGADQRFVELLTWKQETADQVTLNVDFDRPLWGWRLSVDGTDLIFQFRMPPTVAAANPLRGRRIVLDPGHPPGGACGPTGLCEPEANLNIATRVRDQLVAAGATVFMTRSNPEPVSLGSRVALADSLDAELLVSIHNNALPDGVNPFSNDGSSTFFNHAPSLALARAVQARLVANLGVRDLGIARGDLALTRPTWYPAILTEGLFMMVPEQEAALRTTEGQRRYATAVVEGIVAFLKATGEGAHARP